MNAGPFGDGELSLTGGVIGGWLVWWRNIAEGKRPLEESGDDLSLAGELLDDDWGLVDGSRRKLAGYVGIAG
jgi:hypothetical protein